MRSVNCGHLYGVAVTSIICMFEMQQQQKNQGSTTIETGSWYIFFESFVYSVIITIN